MRPLLLAVLLLPATSGLAQQFTLREGTSVRNDAAAAAIATVTSTGAPDGPIIRRSYPVMATVGERIAAVGSDGGPEVDWKKFFGEFGVKWPDGSSIRYFSSIGRIIVQNTPENLETFESVLQDLNVMPSQVEIQMEFVAFDITNIAAVAAKGIMTSDIVALWAEGQGKLIAAPRVVTQSGVEATVKGVTECIYPTEFGGSGTDTTNRIATNSAPAGIPRAFETRETGAILQVLPEVSSEGVMINLTMAPEFVEDPDWRDYGFKEMDEKGRERQTRMEMPFFHIYSVSTSVILEDGQRILISGGMPSRDGKQLVYAFVTARLIGVDGEPIRRKGRDVTPELPGL